MAANEQVGANLSKTLIVQASTGVRADGPVSLYADPTTHRLLVDAGSITTSSASVGTTGAAVPASADYIGISVGGNLTGLTAGQTTMANSVPVVIASNQTGVPVTGTFWQVTQPVSIATAPVLVAGSAIIGKVTTDQTTHGTTDLVAADITKVGGSAISLGQATMANSFPVVLSSNQTSIPVAATLTAETTKVIGTINIAASQTVGLVAGSAIIGKVGIDQTTPGTTNLVALAANQSVNLAQVGAASIALGQNTMANSLPVAIASNQGNVPTNVAQINGVTVLMGNGASGTGAQRVTISNDSSAIALWGHGATAASVPANAVYNGLIGITALPTAVSNGQLVGASGDKYGRQVVLAGTIRDLRLTQATTISASTSETTIVTQIASTFNDLVMLIFSNTSGTATRIDIRDTTGGSILGSVYVPAGDMRGFSIPGEAIPQTTVNTNWTAQCGTSVTDIRVYAVYDKNK